MPVCDFHGFLFMSMIAKIIRANMISQIISMGVIGLLGRVCRLGGFRRCIRRFASRNGRFG